MVSSRRTQVLWVSAFFSPAIYYLLLIFAHHLRMPMPPFVLAVGIFLLLPVVALAVCGTIVWQSGMNTGNKVAWLLFTVFGITLQVGLVATIVRASLIAATGLAHAFGQNLLLAARLQEAPPMFL